MKYFIFLILFSCAGPQPEQTESMVQNSCRLDLQSFWLNFIDSASKGDFNSIKFPIEVECFIDRSKGKIIEKSDFSQYYSQIFNDEFLEQANKTDIYAIAKEYWDAGLYESGVVFKFEFIVNDNSGFEKAIHYKFEKENETWFLTEINCVG